MKEVEEARKVKRIAAVIYLLVMVFLMAGTYISEQQKTEKVLQQKSAEEKVEIVSEPPLY